MTTPSTGSASDFLYTDSPTCERCGGFHLLITEQNCGNLPAYIGWFQRHNLNDCLLENLRRVVREEVRIALEEMTPFRLAATKMAGVLIVPDELYEQMVESLAGVAVDVFKRSEWEARKR